MRQYRQEKGGTVMGGNTFCQVLPAACTGWLGVFVVTLLIMAAVELLERFVK